MEPALAVVRQAPAAAPMETSGLDRACIPWGARPWLDRRLGCDVRVDTERAGAMICAIAMVAANITGATANAIVVLAAMTRLGYAVEKKCLYCQGCVGHLRCDLHFRLQFISCWQF
jgi:hypothetical protein